MTSILTDSQEGAAAWFGVAPGEVAARPAESPREDASNRCEGKILAAAESLLRAGPDRDGRRAHPLMRLRVPGWKAPERFRALLLADRARRSNLDRIALLHRKGVPIPDGLVLAARRGTGFQGRFGRTWLGLAGNLQAVIRLAPRIEAARAGPAFPILPAVACVEAIEALSPGEPRPRIKWINDVFLAGRKVAGVLTRQTLEAPRITDVFLGIGVNILAAPRLRGDPFVPGAASLAELQPGTDWSPGTPACSTRAGRRSSPPTGGRPGSWDGACGSTRTASAPATPRRRSDASWPAGGSRQWTTTSH